MNAAVTAGANALAQKCGCMQPADFVHVQHAQTVVQGIVNSPDVRERFARFCWDGNEGRPGWETLSEEVHEYWRKIGDEYLKLLVAE